MAQDDDEEEPGVFNGLMTRCRELAGVKEKRPIDDWDAEGELENLVTLENAREPLLTYATQPLRVEILKDDETPWTNNFGDTDTIDLPVLKVDRDGRSYYATNTYFMRVRVIRYLLKNLTGIAPESAEIMNRNIRKIKKWDRLYRQMVGY